MEIKLQDYERLIFKQAYRAKSRLAHAGIHVDLDEIKQEGREIFARSVQKFDPDRQVKFSTYLYGALNNSLNRFCDKQRDVNKHGVSLTDSLSDDGGSYLDIIADTNATDPEEALERQQEAIANLNTFQPESVRVIVCLMNPSDALRAEIARMQAFSKEARRRGFGAPRVSFGVEAIMTVMRYTDADKRLVREDIKDFLEFTA